TDIDVADDARLFECGWSWGIVRGAEAVTFVPGRIGTVTGYAEPRPYTPPSRPRSAVSCGRG
ncbi:hypothetical protein, partial [Nocardia wallacei]|uniref:hypothetical protein n=1 Tax=Nocardia wallacei TaxID=480035 RepID=UPI00245611A2